MKISLCLITLNELEGCKKDIPLINKNCFEQIYAIDGGSSDGTIQYLRKQNIPVYIQKQKGLNAAHLYAVKKCKSDAIIFFHPKGTIPVKDTLKFRKFLQQGYDLVVASRMIKGARNEEDDKIIKPRKWFTLGVAYISAMLWKKEGNTIWDILHGVRGINIKTFKMIDLPVEGITIDINTVVGTYKNKIKRIEFPTKEMPRISGETHFKPIPTGIQILKYIFKEALKSI